MSQSLAPSASDSPAEVASAGAEPVAAPFEPIEPPYYAVVFSSLRTPGDHGYGETAERMMELVRKVPGFLGVDSAHTPGGLGITVSYFKDADAIKQWREQMEHRGAQRRGRKEWYEGYAVHVSRVERSYGFVRK